MENSTFSYNYSAARNREVEKIRKKYIPVEESKLERLKRLDRKVQRAGITESLCLGVVGALVFGIGMCFGLDVFSGADWFTILFTVTGTVLMIPAYPIYRRISEKKRSELTGEILRLSDEIIRS